MRNADISDPGNTQTATRRTRLERMERARPLAKKEWMGNLLTVTADLDGTIRHPARI
jgi:hypothetical protein